MSEERRAQLIREAFANLAEDFIRRVDVSESGQMVVHYQNGLPQKRDYSYGGRIPKGLTDEHAR